MAKRKLKEVHFKVHGEFITEHFRERVREGNWEDALYLLKDSLNGFTLEYAIEVLSGRKQLIGVNSVDYVDDDKHKDDDWLRKQYFPYFFNTIMKDGKFYVPYGEVKNLNQEDANLVLEKRGETSIPFDSGHGPNAIFDFNCERAETYRRSNDDIVVYVESKYKWILAEPSNNAHPMWLRGDELKHVANLIMKQEFECTSMDLEEIGDIRKLANRQRFCNRIGGDSLNDYGNNMVDNFVKDMLDADKADNDSLKRRIAEKADRLGGWLEVTNDATGVKHRIPKHAFYRWVLSDSSAYSMHKWGAVSPRGMKMGGDDPNHTDWYLFTGLDFAIAHDERHPEIKFFYDLRYKTHKKLTKSNITPLARGKHKGFKRAKVNLIKTKEEAAKAYVQEDSVIVIPNASPEFELLAIEAAKKNCILISETGGKLCHLAIVGREFGLTLYMLPNALQKLTMTSFISLDTDKDEYKILPMDAEQNIQLKMNGFLYKDE